MNAKTRKDDRDNERRLVAEWLTEMRQACDRQRNGPFDRGDGQYDHCGRCACSQHGVNNSPHPTTHTLIQQRMPVQRKYFAGNMKRNAMSAV